MIYDKTSIQTPCSDSNHFEAKGKKTDPKFVNKRREPVEKPNGEK